jgi:integrase
VFDSQGRRKYLNTAERQAFLTEIEKETNHERRTFCLTLFYTGCRVSEALGVETGRVDLSDKSIVFETLKQRRRGKFRAVPVPDSLIASLADLLQRADGDTQVWKFSRITAYRLVNHLMKDAGILGKMACPRGLRHAFGVACVVKNVPLPTIQKWMGHARLETTAIYLQVMGDEERNLAARIW